MVATCLRFRNSAPMHKDSRKTATFVLIMFPTLNISHAEGIGVP